MVRLIAEVSHADPLVSARRSSRWRRRLTLSFARLAARSVGLGLVSAAARKWSRRVDVSLLADRRYRPSHARSYTRSAGSQRNGLRALSQEANRRSSLCRAEAEEQFEPLVDAGELARRYLSEDSADAALVDRSDMIDEGVGRLREAARPR